MALKANDNPQTWSHPRLRPSLGQAQTQGREMEQESAGHGKENNNMAGQLEWLLPAFSRDPTPARACTATFLLDHIS